MEHPLKKKTSIIMFGLLLAGATANNLRNTVTGAYSDPYCNTFSPDGMCCLKCSYHYFMNSNGRCQAVSDWCKTWDDCTGLCKSCFDGYGVPVNGVCSRTPVGSGGSNGNNCKTGNVEMNNGGTDNVQSSNQQDSIVNLNDDSGRVQAGQGSQARLTAFQGQYEDHDRQSCEENSQENSDEDCSEDISEQKSEDCESKDEKKVKRWRKRHGHKNRRNNSRNSRRSRRSAECSEEKNTYSCEESYSGPHWKSDWNNVHRLGYRQNKHFDNKFGGRLAEKWSQRMERQSRWFSKKSCHDGESKISECEQKSTNEHEDRSHSHKSDKKSNRSCSKSIRSDSKRSHSKKSGKSCSRSLSKKSRHSKKLDCKSQEKSHRSLSKKSCRSLSKKSHHSKRKDCESLSKKSHKSHHSQRKDCESLSKKSHRSLSKKSKHSQRKSRWQGLSDKRVQLKSKHECESKKCAEVKQGCSEKRSCSISKKEKC